MYILLKYLLLILVLTITAMPAMAIAAEKSPGCMAVFSATELEALKSDKFIIASSNKRNHTAVNLLSCLGHPAPDIRDGIVYEALSHWLREDLLTGATVKQLYFSLIDILAKPRVDTDDFTQTFAALVLSEVVRVDRIRAFLSDSERQQAVDISTSYMVNITDYRGFENASGWRHAVAHSADVLLQLALNKKLTKPQLLQLANAIKGQISPQKLHFYIYGEPKRLAMAFIYSLLAISSQSKNPELMAIQPLLLKAIKTLG
jgi:hypothetical protein